MMVDRQNLSSPGSETLDVGLEYYLQTTCPLVLQKVTSEANPKVRNHGEGPY